ncbi:uncharacterized protein LOC129757322 isoform X1 [Uranotaenia lowii]|uniref:uncharacterized protein LOC129757322 isoform X1 n=1 Tax=Uranotaenia lowii TaxID=190385 RepID=UPI00247A908F|nr:uncharacterized protein LOC129757322 isoform X1 [Uranotaenia lowii]XP_055610484.1 uncharacterized protein LOC129757322 isoform X1 [Uranotaenia lowii]
MATRLATQRNFITVTPIPTTVASAAAVESPAQAATTGPQQQSDASDGGEDSSPNSTPTSTNSATPATSSNAITANTTVVSSPLKNGTGKSAALASTQVETTPASAALNNSVIPTSLIANNLSIANLLGAQNGGLALQQLIQQKKIVIHPNGTVIDIVPLDGADSPEDSKLGVQIADGSSSPASSGEQHVTAQVAVVQAQSPTDGGPQYITVTATAPPVSEFTEADEENEEDVRSYASLTAIDVSSPDNVQNHHTYVQYVDSDMYTTAGQGQTQMAYPVYAVGDYSSTAGGQQYYATGGNGGGGGNGTSGGNGTGASTYSASGNSSHSSTSSNGGGGGGGGGPGNSSNGGTNGSGQQYIVPVDEATLLGTNGAHQRESPQTMTDVASYIQSHQVSHHSNSTTPTPDMDSTPNLSHATRVSPATVRFFLHF